MKKKILSILLATRNQKEYLNQCISAIRSQTFVHWELLVYDDASRDGTANYLKVLRLKEPRLRFFRALQHRGPVHGYNFLLRQAIGKFVWSVASDDFCVRKDFLAEGFSKLVKFPSSAGFCSSCLTLYEPSGTMGPRMTMPKNAEYLSPHDIMRGFFSHHGNIPGSSMVIRKKEILRFGGFRPELGPMCDLFVNHAAGTKRGVVYLSNPGVCVRIFESHAKSFGQRSTIHQWTTWIARLEILLRKEFPENSFSIFDWMNWRMQRINDYLQTDHRFRIASRSPVETRGKILTNLKRELKYVICILNRKLSDQDRSDLVIPISPQACIKFTRKNALRRIYTRILNSLRKRILGYSLPH